MTGPAQDPNTIRTGIREARQRREQANTAQEQATADLADWAVAGRDARIPIVEMAQLAGMHRNGLHNLIAWRTGEKATRK